MANSQADVFNTKETLSQISKTRLSFAHLVDDLESMKNLSAHIDEEMSELKKEFKTLHRYGWSAGSSSSSQPMSTDFSALQATMSENSERMEHLLHTRLSTIKAQMKFSLTSMDKRLSDIETILIPIPPPST